MKKSILTLGAGAALLLGASTAHASNCSTISCLNKNVSRLQRQVKFDTQLLHLDDNAFRSLARCLGEVPVSEYGDPAGSYGYVWNNGGGLPLINITALDVSASGDPATWFMIDSCNTQNAMTKVHQTLRNVARMTPAFLRGVR